METYTHTPRELTAEDERIREMVKATVDNPYVGSTREGKPGHKPRPTRDDRRFASDRDDTRLREHQQQWDAAEAWATHGDALGERRRTEREAAKDAERQRVQKIQDERTATARAELDTWLRADFLSTPGTTPEDWERNRQAIIDDHLREQARVNSSAARRAHAAIYADF